MGGRIADAHALTCHRCLPDLASDHGTAAALAPETGDAFAAETGFDPRELDEPYRGVRKATAEAMVASDFTAPHVTEFVQVDVTRTMRLVRELRESRRAGAGQAEPAAPRREGPADGASPASGGQRLVGRGRPGDRRQGRVNLGIAAATPRRPARPEHQGRGQQVPAGARPPRCGTWSRRPGRAGLPWVHKGKVVPRQVTTPTLSFDHGLVDGELGSRVLADTAAILERPKRLITWAKSG